MNSSHLWWGNDNLRHTRSSTVFVPYFAQVACFRRSRGPSNSPSSPLSFHFGMRKIPLLPLFPQSTQARLRKTNAFEGREMEGREKGDAVVSQTSSISLFL